MEQKKLIMFFMTIGSVVGGYIPSLWDESMFSLSSIIFSAIGGFLGIWLGYRLSQ